MSSGIGAINLYQNKTICTIPTESIPMEILQMIDQFCYYQCIVCRCNIINDESKYSNRSQTYGIVDSNPEILICKQCSLKIDEEIETNSNKQTKYFRCQCSNEQLIAASVCKPKCEKHIKSENKCLNVFSNLKDTNNMKSVAFYDSKIVCFDCQTNCINENEAWICSTCHKIVCVDGPIKHICHVCFEIFYQHCGDKFTRNCANCIDMEICLTCLKQLDNKCISCHALMIAPS